MISTNGRKQLTKSGWAESGGYKEKRKNATAMRGQGVDKFGGSGGRMEEEGE